MEKEFIPYKQALELKELGFDESCLDKYDPRFEKLSSNMETWSNEHYPETLMIPAPLYQQAFRWFREKYNLQFWVEPSFKSEHQTDGYVYYIKNNAPYSIDFSTYEKAELACLDKLIEMVKEK